MNLLPNCILFTRDADLRRRVSAFLSSAAQIHPVDRVEHLEEFLARGEGALVLLDLRQDDAAKLLPRFHAEWPRAVVIALGLPRSEPMLAAEERAVYAAEDINADRRQLQALLARALEHTRLLLENQVLREGAVKDGARARADPAQRQTARRLEFITLQHFSRAFRSSENIQTLLNQMVEAVASAALVPRVGIFVRLRDNASFRLRSGLRCLETTRQLEFAGRDPFVRWISDNAHLVARSTLQYVSNPRDQVLLKQALDAMGAEVILPLQGQRRLSGWMFLGHRATGAPFENENLEELMVMTEHAAVILENALLVEEISIQNTLTETLLRSLPVGIVTADSDGIVRWCNSVAGQVLNIAADRVINQPVAMLGSQLADFIWRALKGEALPESCELNDPGGRRHLTAQLRRLADRDQCLGAVALIHDMTRERRLLQKQAHVERISFWNELAAAMSHEIRNPLVAISTFAQLLTERYADPDFRGEFRKVVANEIERLNGITEQINAFAHPPEPALKELDLGNVIEKSIAMARGRMAAFGKIPAATAVAAHLPRLTGDERALTECFANVVANALEAVATAKNPKIQITAEARQSGQMTTAITVAIRDNGNGIAPAMLDKVFSPFYTTKARGLGLGLAIAQRAVLDHGGQISLDSTKAGTSVIITLPVGGDKAEAKAAQGPAGGA